MFQATIIPLGGLIPRACEDSGSTPCQSYSPVPIVGSPMSTPGARRGSLAAEKKAMSRLSAYTQLNENSSWFMTLKNSFADRTLFVFRSAKASALATSRP